MKHDLLVRTKPEMYRFNALAYFGLLIFTLFAVLMLTNAAQRPASAAGTEKSVLELSFEDLDAASRALMNARTIVWELRSDQVNSENALKELRDNINRAQDAIGNINRTSISDECTMDNRSNQQKEWCMEDMLNAKKNYIMTAMSELNAAKAKCGIIKDNELRKKVVDFLGKAIDHLK